ncbi:HAMP domain-containing protein [Pseudonocardia sp. MCCB 268]|nr:HAMP domain-containing protein [Pseudonocardia cytotoxica]
MAERFAGGHLDERMDVRGEDEVARLAESFNEMASASRADRAAGGVRRVAAPVHLGRQPRAAHPADHRPDGRRRAVRVPGRAAARPAAQLRATGHRGWTGSRRCSPTCSRSPGSDAGVAELGAEQIDPTAVVRHAVDTVRGLAADAGTELVLDLPATNGTSRPIRAGSSGSSEPGGERDRPR